MLKYRLICNYNLVYIMYMYINAFDYKYYDKNMLKFLAIFVKIENDVCVTSFQLFPDVWESIVSIQKKNDDFYCVASI